ncbi:MAG: chloride channel protein [Armatimonadetes bacterium]|nr:chloride channel protein [Armatimonadota bacterium]
MPSHKKSSPSPHSPTTESRPETLDSSGFRSSYISMLAAVIGVIAGLIAYSFYHLIGLFTNLFFFHRLSFQFSSPYNNHIGAWVILVPVIGGLIIGVLAKYGTPKIRGHGIPEAIEAVLAEQSRISLRVAILKPTSAALAIGTGGPFGAEGPIIQTGGAVGSLIGQVLPVTASERRTLLACGASAGMAATFSTPISGAILALELLVFEFKARSLIPIIIASGIATAAHYVLMGTGPLFPMKPVNFGIPAQIPFYLILGIICGLTAWVFSRSLYGVEDWFENLPIDRLWWPALGALALGIIGYFVPRVFGVGYDTITGILNNQFALKFLTLIAVFKSLALILSLGSGTSGGLLAPMFMSSAAMGAVYAIMLNHLFPGAHLEPGAYALTAMGAVFGAAARAPFAFMIFPFEITHNYASIIPLMLVGAVADGVARAIMPNSIMTEKLARRGMQIPQSGFESDVLHQISIADVMEPVSNKTGLVHNTPQTESDISNKISHEAMGAHPNGVVINQTDLMTASAVSQSSSEQKGSAEQNPDHLASDGFKASIYSDESLFQAIRKMAMENIDRLAVVDRSDGAKVVGYLGLNALFSGYRRRIEEDLHREPGILTRSKGKSVPE